MPRDDETLFRYAKINRSANLEAGESFAAAGSLLMLLSIAGKYVIGSEFGSWL